jgi:hypothetical protein
LTTNQNQKHLGLVVENNASSNLEIRQLIMEATLDLTKRYYTLMAEKMSVSNADMLARFIISARKERNIALNAVKIT